MAPPDDGVGAVGVRPLDTAKEMARYGADTLGDVGVSIPAPT